jgi:hypothetical protein
MVRNSEFAHLVPISQRPEVGWRQGGEVVIARIITYHLWNEKPNFANLEYITIMYFVILTKTDHREPYWFIDEMKRSTAALFCP